MGGYHATPTPPPAFTDLSTQPLALHMTDAARPADPDAPQAGADADAIVGTHTPQRLRHIGRWRLTALGCTLGLIALGMAWELWLAPLPGGTGVLALKVLPLTLAIAGLLKHKLYTYRWLSLLVWLYFTEGIVRLTSDRLPMSQALAGIELALSILLFASCAVYVRLRLKVLPPKVKGGRPEQDTGQAP